MAKREIYKKCNMSERFLEYDIKPERKKEILLIQFTKNFAKAELNHDMLWYKISLQPVSYSKETIVT
jgi:hypothetical protein